MSDRKWTNDPFAEQQMKKLAVAWVIEVISIASVDWEKTKENHARIGGAIDEGFVDELAIGIQNGDELPMPVLRMVGKSYEIFAGHHRVPAAKKVGLKEIPAYIFESNDDAVIGNLNKMLNAPVRQVDRASRLIFARDGVLKYGFTTNKAAKLYALSEKSLSVYIRSENTREKLARMGVDGITRLPCSTLETLGRIKNTNVIKSAARFICQGKLNSIESATLVRDILSEGTESAMIGIVGRAEKEAGLDGNVTAKMSPVVESGKRRPATSILIAIATIEKKINMRTINQWGITDKAQKEQIIGRLCRLAKAIREICKRST
jgi:hypothetical protein